MPEDPNLTATTEPADGSTSGEAPDSDSAADSSTEAPQPTVEEMQERIKRLEANYSGTRKEWEREKSERERLTQQNDYLMRQVQHPAAPQAAAPARGPSPEYRQVSETFYQAVLDGDKDKMAGILEDIGSRPMAQMGQLLQASAQFQFRQQSFNTYLDKRGIKPGSELHREAQTRIEAAKSNPEYAWATDQNALQAAVVGDLLIERAGNLGVAKEKARKDQVDAAFTEGTGKGSLPGKSAGGGEKVHLTQEEMKMVRHMQRADGISEEAAKKKYWEHLPPNVRQARKDAGRAV